MNQVTAIIQNSIGSDRYLDSSHNIPSAPADVDSNRKMLSWVHRAFNHKGISKQKDIGGYHIKKAIENSPEFSYLFHRDWQQAGELGALRQIDCDESRDHLIIRSKIGLFITAVASVFCLRGLMQRIGSEYKIVRMSFKTPACVGLVVYVQAIFR